MQSVSWPEGVEGQVGGYRQHLLTISHEGFHGLSYLEGTLGLFHFKGVKLECSFSQAWGVGLPYRSSNAFNFNLFFRANPLQSKAIGKQLKPIFLSFLV